MGLTDAEGKRNMRRSNGLQNEVAITKGTAITHHNITKGRYSRHRLKSATLINALLRRLSNASLVFRS